MNLIYKEDALACCTDYGFTKAKEVMDAINDLPVVDVSLLKDTKATYTDLPEAAETLKRLEKADPFDFPYTAADAEIDAANTIRSLLAHITAMEAERNEAINQLDSANHSIDVLEKRVAHFMERNEAAETALAAMTKERDDLANANYRQASCIHVAAANLGPNCSATVDGLPKAARHVAAERDALLLAAQGLVEVLDQNETKGPLPDTALMFCWLAAQNVRAVLRGIMLGKPE